MSKTVPIPLHDALYRARPSSGADGATLAKTAVFLLSLATFLSLFVFRAYDDNRLTSWHWVFSDNDLFKTALLLAAGLLLAYPLARLRFPRYGAAGALFAAAFATAALTWEEPEVIVDVARYFTQAKHVELYGVGHFLTEWGGQIGVWTDLPLVSLLYGLILSLFGEQRIFIQLFNTLLFSGSVVLTYLIGKTLWDETIGFCAGALLLGMPYLLTQVPLMLVDVPTMFFLTLAIFMTIRAMELGGMENVALAALAIALAVCTKYSAWLMLSVLPVAFLSRHWKSPRAAWLRAGALAVISAVLVGALLLPMLDVVREQIGLLQSYQASGLRRWEESFTSTFLFQIHPLISGAALFSAYAAFKRRDARYLTILWLPLLLLVLEIKRIRYLLPMFPMLALMASYGLREIRVGEIRKYVVLSIVVSSLVVLVSGFLPFLRQQSAANLKQAGIYLDSLKGDAVEVIALPQLHALVNPAVSVPILDLFTSKRLVYRHDPVPAPQARTLAETSLRFTWEIGSPTYYAAAPSHKAPSAIAVIASDPAQPQPEGVSAKLKGHRLAREFAVSEHVFGYQTLVRVYLPILASPRT